MSDIEDSVSPSSFEASPSTRTTPSPGKRKEPMTLPLPSGTLPPRKRAKTKDEKEQRRIERIMRNRQAAHASREKKRRHVEELETKCVNLEEENKKLNLKISNLSQVKKAMMAKNKNALEKLSILFADIKAGNVDKIDSFDLSQFKFKEDEEVEYSDYEEENDVDQTTDYRDVQEPSLSGLLEVESIKPPDSLILSTFTAPSLSSSVASSPQSSSDSDEQQDSTLPPSEFVSLFETSTMIRTHHPAEVMSSDLQRRSVPMIRFLRTLLTRMSLIF